MNDLIDKDRLSVKKTELRPLLGKIVYYKSNIFPLFSILCGSKVFLMPLIN